jgi:hypothetical protein
MLIIESLLNANVFVFIKSLTLTNNIQVFDMPEFLLSNPNLGLIY